MTHEKPTPLRPLLVINQPVLLPRSVAKHLPLAPPLAFGARKPCQQSTTVQSLASRIR